MSNIHSVPLLQHLFKILSYQRKIQLIGLFFLMVLGTIAELVSLGMIMPFLGVLTNGEKVFEHAWAKPLIVFLDINQSYQLLALVTVLFSLAAILSGIIRFALLWAQTRLGNAIGSDLGALAYQRILHQPYAVHIKRNSSEVIVLLINKINTIINFVVIPLLMLITSALIVISISLFMLMVDPNIAMLIFASFGFIYVGIAYATKKNLLIDGIKVSQYQNEISKVVQEGLGGIRDIIIDGLQEVYVALFRHSDLKLRRALSNVAIISGSPRMVLETFGLILIAWIAYGLAAQGDSLENIIPTLGAFALAAQRILPVAQQAYSSWTTILGGLSSLRDLLEKLGLPLCQSTAHINPLKFNQKLELNNIRFQYHTTGSLILDRINMVIHRGDRIGFTGKTGSGKSTLLDVIMALLEPTSGKILVDGVEINAHNRRRWQAHIAHVPQSIFLADASIAENIAFGVKLENIDLERLQVAAEGAQIARTIESWPNGYQTRVGERGLQLSGGQRQRIGIARALYKKASILIFDEATSALDMDTEKALMASLNAINKDVTILMVAHRLTTLRHCTQVVRLEDGCVLETGDYLTLCGNTRI